MLDTKKIKALKEILSGMYQGDTTERVGFVLPQHIIEVPNVSPDPTYGFMVSGADIIKHVEEMDAIGTWHTHPDQDSNLSGEDLRMFRSWPDLVHFIVGNDGVRAYQFNSEKNAVLEL